MADYNAASSAESQRLTIQRMIDKLHIALPCVVMKFTSSDLSVDVQVSTQLKVTLGKEVYYKSFPVISNVPVVVPYVQTAGLMLTLPIQVGDTGLLIVPDRGIDNFLNSDGNPTPPPFAGDPSIAAPRSHALTDAIYIPGLSTKLKPITNYNAQNIELRDSERKSYISLGPDGIELTDGTCILSMKNGNFDITTTGTTTVQSANVSIDNEQSRFSGDVTSEGISLRTHVHSGVEVGTETTGAPQ